MEAYSQVEMQEMERHAVMAAALHQHGSVQAAGHWREPAMEIAPVAVLAHVPIVVSLATARRLVRHQNDHPSQVEPRVLG